ncbi:MAG: PaaI family thioesterase [Caulobacterales bacterium]
MTKWAVKLSADELNRLLGVAFGGPSDLGLVKHVEPGLIRLMRPYGPGMLRPGNLIAGPVLMSLADTAAYTLVMAHIGPELMAVTSSLTIHFLCGAKPGDIEIEGRLLSLGRRNVVCDVRLWTESPERIAAHATVTYARPLTHR